MHRNIKSDHCTLQIYEDKFNKRIRLDSYEGKPEDVSDCIHLNLPVWTEKLILKVRQSDLTYFLSKGFKREAFIGGYFNGEDMYFVTKYPKEDRANSTSEAINQEVIDKILATEQVPPSKPKGEIRIASREDASDLANFFSEIFEIYPVPITSEDFIFESMDRGTIFAHISENGKIQSAASAEINEQFSNAELTDCATRDSARGKGHMQQLIIKLEEILQEKGIKCMYTIARSKSFGINKVFHNLGYTYGGLLINNCYIYSGLEDMSVWYKVRPQ